MSAVVWQFRCSKTCCCSAVQPERVCRHLIYHGVCVCVRMTYACDARVRYRGAHHGGDHAGHGGPWKVNWSGLRAVNPWPLGARAMDLLVDLLAGLLSPSLQAFPDANF